MKLTALMPVRNEAWAVGLTARVALMWCDELMLLDHASVDRTPAILRELKSEYKDRVHIMHDADPAWREMGQRQSLLDAARKRGATHIAIVDADEVLTGNLLPTIRAEILTLPAAHSLQVGMPCVWRSLDEYRTDSRIWSNRFDLTLAFRDAPGLSWKTTNGYDHHHREPLGCRLARRLYGQEGGVMHLQWVSWRRLVAKHALYKMMERVKYPNKPVAEIERLYSLALDEQGLKLASVPSHWWEPYRNLMQHVNLNEEPWQEAECRILHKEHGAGYFKGLNLFGVVHA